MFFNIFVNIVAVFIGDGFPVFVGNENRHEGKLELENVKLWQPLNSYLYQIKVTAGEDVYTLPYDTIEEIEKELETNAQETEQRY